MIFSHSIAEQVGNTPLVHLQSISKDSPAPVFGKCEYLNPTGSGKDRIAKAIVEAAERQGKIRPGDTLIEASAGNTGLGLAMMAAVRGYRLVCVMPEKMSVDKRAALRAAGAELVISENAPLTDPRNFQQVARRLAQENGWFLTDQFVTEENARIHEETTGPEIIKQCGAPAAFVCGIGTGGTITGVARHFRDAAPNCQIILADPIGSRLAHMIDPALIDSDAPYAVEGIGGSAFPEACDRGCIHAAVQVSDAESFSMTRRLITEEGLFVGGSAGTGVCAALRYAEKHRITGPIVVILPDSWDRYTSCKWLRPSVEKELAASTGSEH